MNIDLKPIADSKVRQLGGDVCGVLVRNEAGAWAAVSEGGRVMWLDDFEPLPVARNEDVALPSHATKSDLIDCIDLMADEFKRIKALNPGDEILDLCDRALRVTEQNVPVLEVRDRLQKTVSKLLWKVSDLEDQLEAARAQSGQGAEPVALLQREIGESTWFDHVPVKPNTREAEGLKASPILDYCEVYTHPQPAQQGSVPEGWVLHAKVNMPAPDHKGQRVIGYRVTIPEGGWSGAFDWLPSLTTPQPEGDEWKAGFDYSAAFIKRKQAEAVEAAAMEYKYGMEAEDMLKAVKDYAQRLRQKPPKPSGREVRSER